MSSNKKRLLFFIGISILVVILIRNSWYSNENDALQLNSDDALLDPSPPSQQGYEEFFKQGQLIAEWCDGSELALTDNCSQIVQQFKPLNKHLANGKLGKCAHRSQCFNRRTTNYHTFWRMTDNIQFYERVLDLNIMSFLYTQDLCCAKFFLWTDDTFPQVVKIAILRKFASYITAGIIETKTVDISETCPGTIFERHTICRKGRRLPDRDSVKLSDFVRFFVLAKYGGIYTDGDVIYLKDMRPLWNLSFVYRWSYTKKYNTAVLGVSLIDPRIVNMYKRILEEKNNHDMNSLISAFHPHRITQTVHDLNGRIFSYAGLTVFHSHLFDPAWLCNDGSEPNVKPICAFHLFSKRIPMNESYFRPESFFANAFAFHLHHGSLGFAIDDSSYFAYFERFYHNVLELH